MAVDIFFFLYIMFYMEDIKENIKVNLIRLRKENKFTQQDLAKKINYSDKAISRWEQGESLPDISVLLQVCELYGVDFEWLIHSHEQDEKIKAKRSQKLSMQIAIACLVVVSCFTLATVFYVYSLMFHSISSWTLFLWAIPLSCVSLLVICRKWFNSLVKLITCSVFIWSLITCIYVSVYQNNNIWALFFIGVPLQAITTLLYFIKENKN